jgi:hypothetical protein
MALRLRRGTNAERLLITPVEGELIYTTDTKLLYVGDGNTVGGTLVTGAGGGGSATLDGLTDTDVADAQNSDVLTFVGSSGKWEAVAIPGVGSIAISDLDDVFIFTDPVVNDALIYDGLNWTARSIKDFFNEQQTYKINIAGDDSTIIIDTDTNRVTGDFFGNLTGNVSGNVEGAVVGTLIGDHIGSVFADDSSAIVDGITGNVSANDLSIGGGRLIFESFGNNLVVSSSINTTKMETAVIKTNVFNVVGDLTNQEGASFTTSTSRGTPLEPTGLVSGDFSGAVTFSAYYTPLSDYRLNAGIFSSIDTVTGTDLIPGKLSVALRDPDGAIFSALSVNSRGVTEAPIFKPTAYADTTARDAAITSPEAGMVIFVTDSDGGGTEALQVYKATGGWTTIS